MFKPVKISPSILSADFLNMADELEMMQNAGADWVHVDVMDGHFVPNLTMGVPLVKQLARATEMPLDVHLMISNPLVQIPWFLDAGADLVTFHIEAATPEEAVRAVHMIHDAGALAGVAVKPKTPMDAISCVVDDVDMVLVMSVEPGFSGQSYIEGSDVRVDEAVEMVRACQQQRLENGRDASPFIQVDGGIGMATLGAVVAAGADVLVCGNAVFAAADAPAALQEIKGAAEAARMASASISDARGNSF